MGLDWLLYAFLSAILWGIGGIILKFVRVRYINSPIGYIVLASPAWLSVFLLLIWFDYTLPSNVQLGYIFGSMVCGNLAYWLIIAAAKTEDPSRISTLAGIIPIITLVLATIFLGEALSFTDYLAFPFVITGATLISLQKFKEKWHFSNGMLMAIGANLFWGISQVFLKAAHEVDFVSVFITRQVMFLTSIILLISFSKKVRQKTRDDFKQLNRKNLSLVYIVEITGLIGLIAAFFALQRGPVSLVTLAQSTEGLFVIGMVSILSFFGLKLEDTSKTLPLKITAAILIMIGVYLITI